LAVVGCGGAGRLHLDACARAGISPSVLVDRDPGRLDELARRWPGVSVAESAADVADRFDVAVVAVPDRHHASVAIALLAAGKDVLVEKPMAGGRREAQEMVAAAAEAGRTLAVAHVRRHLAVKSWAHEVVASGRLGAVEAIEVSQGGLDHWVADTGGYVQEAVGGALADQGAHSIDLLTWWFGALEVRSCVDDARGGHEADATVEAVAAGGVPVRLEVSRVRPRRNTIRVHAERGTLEVALDHYQPRQVVQVPAGLAARPFDQRPEDLAVQFDRQLAAFAAALGGAWPTTLATAADGASVAGVIEDCRALRRPEELEWMRSATA
ncbi:MAG TPA: Gfo/Idh/MocA family oxidoreductase, partial [Aquihabitans sp.]|nr:Gfo/Idh/MocA family oxidoreductase [Aquihabitans sp.]